MLPNDLARPGGRSSVSRRRVVVGALPFLTTIVAACSGAPNLANQANRLAPGQALTTSDTSLVAYPARDQWPEVFRQAAPEVQDAYRYAVANQDVLKYIPCYCGCVSQGMTSNRDCYVRETRPDGSVVLDPMSFG